MPFGAVVGPALAAGGATGPLAPIAIPVSILLSAIFGRKLFGGGKEQGPQPYGVGEWQINPGDPWYGQPVDPNSGLHQSLVNQIWSMAPPEGLPASMLQSNPTLGIPNWAALRLQRIGWELSGGAGGPESWQNLLNVLKSGPVDRLPDWLTSRMQWGINPLVEGSQGGVPYDMSEWLRFSTTVYGAPWGLIVRPDGGSEMGPIPEGEQPDYIDPATGMPVYSVDVTELPGEGIPPPEPEFPGPPPIQPQPPPHDRGGGGGGGEPDRGGRMPRFVTDVTELTPQLPPPDLPEPEFPGPPTRPIPPPVEPVLPIPEPTPPPIQPELPTPVTPVETPGPPAGGGATPTIPNLPAALGGLSGLGGGGPLPGGFVVVPGGNPYQSLFRLPIPGVQPVPTLGQFIGR